MTIEITPEMDRAMYQALAAAEPGRHHAAVRKGLSDVLALAEKPLRVAGYENAIAILQGVAQRTGSPAAKWAAEYLAVDPDKEGPRRSGSGSELGREQQIRMVEHGRELLKGYDCPDHPGPLDDARDHICRLRPVRSADDWDDDPLQETYPGSGIYE